MKSTPNILQIKNKRENRHQDIEIPVLKIAYITHKKDGRYFQPFELIETLATPLVITGNLLARTENKYLEEGEHEFTVYDKTGDDYILNPNKSLLVTTAYDYDTDETILTSVEYTITIPNEEFNQLKSRLGNKKVQQPERKRSKK